MGTGKEEGIETKQRGEGDRDVEGTGEVDRERGQGERGGLTEHAREVGASQVGLLTPARTGVTQTSSKFEYPFIFQSLEN